MVTKIEWADETINPMGWGCYGPGGTPEKPRICSYCYAARMARGPWAKARGCQSCRDFIPHWHPEQLQKPYHWKKPRRIFVQSMGDLMGPWVPDIYIELTINVAHQNPRHDFLFLTKNPARYLDHLFPGNCHLGTTITGKHSGKDWPNDIEGIERAEIITQVENQTFLSIEPIQGPFWGHRFDRIDQIIIGAQTGPGAPKPLKEWVKSIDHPKIFLKDNIKPFLEGGDAKK